MKRQIEVNWADKYLTSVTDTFIKVDESTILINKDCFPWLGSIPDNSVHAIVTDPPYGVKEFEHDQIEKMNNRKGGIWRLPPAFDGNVRSPLPRFTALNKKEILSLKNFFQELGKLFQAKLVPGGHVFIASNSFLSLNVFSSLAEGGLEYRGEIIRLVRTMRGGDRPKNYEREFPEVCSLPRGCFEPWGIFRKSIPKNMTVGECLRNYGTGGIRRVSDLKPFEDVIESRRTPSSEKSIGDHPSVKPFDFMKKLVHASLPLGKGVVVDPFMGSGSTIAAAKILGYKSIGIERNREYFESAKKSIKTTSKFEKLRLTGGFL